MSTQRLAAAARRALASRLPRAFLETAVGGGPGCPRGDPVARHLARWTRAARAHAQPYGAPPHVQRIVPDDAKPESRGARAARLLRARVQHEVRMCKEQAKEELAQEHWVRRKLADARNAEAAGDRLARRAVALHDDVPRDRQRCIRVGVVGVPNAGKSQLVNTLVGAPVAAVSPKTNTTRVETLAAVTRGDAQVILLDLPGIVGPEHYRNPTHATKVTSAWSAAAGCDALLFIVDAHRQCRRPDPRVERLVESAAENLGRLRYAEETGLRAPPSVLALNKVDLFEAEDRDELKRLARRLSAMHPFDHLYPISAKRGKGTQALLDHFLLSAPTRPWDLEPTRATDRSMIDQAIEVVRECVYRRLHQELPYNIVPIHDSWENFDNGSYKIEQLLMVDSVSAKQIVVGRRGSTIGQIGIRARTILEEMFGRRVHLVLHVKVRKKNNTVRGRRRAEAFAKF